MGGDQLGRDLGFALHPVFPDMAVDEPPFTGPRARRKEAIRRTGIIRRTAPGAGRIEMPRPETGLGGFRPLPQVDGLRGALMRAKDRPEFGRFILRIWMSVAAVVLLTVSTVSARSGTICTILMDARSAEILLEDGDCASRVTPTSTFKIPLAVMAYDAGILKGVHDPVMTFRPGDADWGANWKRDTDPADWMRYSVLWYSQRITKAMGSAALTRYAQEFGYGNADFSGDPGFENGLERAWVSSSLQISPREQANFLRSLVLETLPVDRQAMSRARDLVEAHRSGGWQVYGKTGGAYPRRADRSFDYAHGWGWYVGWARREGEERVLIFARLTQATARTSASPGQLTREAFLQEWPQLAEGQ
ncbi:class D beta-lactamase [Paracoccus pacificus]|uniref:Class D beta-lactamase n=1 Tax=Paracoccus pacificus TaxID=1463598 RepID=A0ABW4R7B2_9RHOB